MIYKTMTALALAALTIPAAAQTPVAPLVSAQPPMSVAPRTAPSATSTTLPVETMIAVTPVQDITSKKMKEGDVVALQVANDITHNGVVVIPRGAPVKGTITWHTGRGIGGKSAKYEVTFNHVTVGGRQYALRGKHRQEGKGNTVAALLGSMLISGKSAVMVQGQLINAFTAEPITI